MTDSPVQSDKTLHGAVPPMATAAERNAALEKAFDYRGDVTIELNNGQLVEGYIFDRRGDGPEPYVRLMVKDADDRMSVKYSDIKRLVFSGRDTAAGKSWETWVKKYSEKKAAGEKASIESEPLE